MWRPALKILALILATLLLAWSVDHRAAKYQEDFKPKLSQCSAGYARCAEPAFFYWPEEKTSSKRKKHITYRELPRARQGKYSSKGGQVPEAP